MNNQELKDALEDVQSIVAAARSVGRLKFSDVSPIYAQLVYGETEMSMLTPEHLYKILAQAISHDAITLDQAKFVIGFIQEYEEL